MVLNLSLICLELWVIRRGTYTFNSILNVLKSVIKLMKYMGSLELNLYLRGKSFLKEFAFWDSPKKVN